MPTVEVQPDLFKWARKRSRKSPKKLAAEFPRLEDWESGKTAPTLRQLEAFARKTSTPLGYFFLAEPPEIELPIPDYRTRRGEAPEEPSANLLDTVQTMQLRQEWMRDFLIEEGAPELPFVASLRMGTPPVRAAQSIRSTLQLAANWASAYATWTAALRALRDAIESIGVLVVQNGVVGNNTHRKLEPDEFQGFVLLDDHAPLVFVNGADYKAAQLFTLAHELAHIWFGEAGVFRLPDLQPTDHEVERVCNAVAAEFLVPEVLFRRAWQTVQEQPDPFAALARVFKVSGVVVARRAQDLGFISRDEFFAFYNAYQVRENARPAPDGGDFYANQNGRVGRRFASAVAQATRQGRLLYSDAYRLTGLSGDTFHKYVRTLDTQAAG